MQQELDNKIKYSIITPTYSRPELLEKTLCSVLGQSHSDWEIIIINDSPYYDYSIFENKYIINSKAFSSNFQNNPEQIIDVNLTKIKYFKNEKNLGVNFSRNFALDYIEKGNLANTSITKSSTVKTNLEYIIFLDDDDWLAPDALSNITDIINRENKLEWLVTNRSHNNKKLVQIRKIKKGNIFNYFYNCLIFKNFKGDVTHAIKKDIALKSRFCQKVKQGEEWYYFINLPKNFLYVDINTTETNGYSDSGLTSDLKDKYIKNTKVLFREKKNLKVFIILIIRILNIIVKTIFK